MSNPLSLLLPFSLLFPDLLFLCGASVLGPVAAYLCPHQCSGPESARTCGGPGPGPGPDPDPDPDPGPGGVGGTADSPQVVPAPVSSHPVFGLWVPAQRLSASWGWYQRWSRGGGQVWAVNGQHFCGLLLPVLQLTESGCM